MDKFLTELGALLGKHGLKIDGLMRIRTDGEQEALEIVDEVYHAGCKDACGPFLTATLRLKEAVHTGPMNANGLRVMVSSDYEAYECPKTGRMIEGRAAHRENLKRTGCRVYEAGETREILETRERDFNDACESAAERWTTEAIREMNW